MDPGLSALGPGWGSPGCRPTAHAPHAQRGRAGRWAAGPGGGGRLATQAHPPPRPPGDKAARDKGAANTCRSWLGCRFSLPKPLQLPTVTGIKLRGPDGGLRQPGEGRGREGRTGGKGSPGAGEGAGANGKGLWDQGRAVGQGGQDGAGRVWVGDGGWAGENQIRGEQGREGRGSVGILREERVGERKVKGGQGAKGTRRWEGDEDQERTDDQRRSERWSC